MFGMYSLSVSITLSPTLRFVRPTLLGNLYAHIAQSTTARASLAARPTIRQTRITMSTYGRRE